MSNHQPETPRSFLPGLLLLAIATVCAALLVWGSRGTLPGCGPESACQRLSRGPWGSLPWLGWSTAHVGLAWFVGLTSAWVFARGALDPWLRRLALGGGLASLLLVGVMLVERSPCPYCLAVHAANLAFLALLLRTPPAPLRVRALLAFALAAAGTALALVVDEQRASRSQERQAEAELQRLGETVAGREQARASEPGHAATTPALPGASDAPASSGSPRAFTGRWRLGPERAAVRIVAFSDYQCPDCRRVEAELVAVLERHPTVSLSAKHYPFCSDCNDVARELSFNPHPNACRAARAAEAAGLLGGNEAFWRVHRWLFERQGRFTDDELRAAAAGLGLDPARLLQEMSGERSLALVRADIEEGTGLGLRMTPMVFFNGVEWRGWPVPGALPKAVEVLLQQGLEPRDASADRPPDALSKALEDWRSGPRRSLRDPAQRRWLVGPDAPTVDLVLWGDYEEANTRQLDPLLRRLAGQRAGLRYSFRHYPLDRACNPLATRTVHASACVAARVAEAAGAVGGDEAFWDMHAWLMEHRERDAPALRAAATRIGLDVDRFWSAMREPALQARLQEDALDGQRAGLSAVPCLLIDGRHLPRWELDGELLFERVVDELLGR